MVHPRIGTVIPTKPDHTPTYSENNAIFYGKSVKENTAKKNINVGLLFIKALAGIYKYVIKPVVNVVIYIGSLIKEARQSISEKLFSTSEIQPLERCHFKLIPDKIEQKLFRSKLIKEFYVLKPADELPISETTDNLEVSEVPKELLIHQVNDHQASTYLKDVTKLPEDLKIKTSIGYSSSSVVFSGTFTDTKGNMHDAAIKIIDKNQEENTRPRILKEIKNLLATQQHDNFVNFLDAYETKDHYYIVTEYAGSSFKQLLTKELQEIKSSEKELKEIEDHPKGSEEYYTEEPKEVKKPKKVKKPAEFYMRSIIQNTMNIGCLLYKSADCLKTLLAQNIAYNNFNSDNILYHNQHVKLCGLGGLDVKVDASTLPLNTSIYMNIISYQTYICNYLFDTLNKISLMRKIPWFEEYHTPKQREEIFQKYFKPELDKNSLIEEGHKQKLQKFLVASHSGNFICTESLTENCLMNCCLFYQNILNTKSYEYGASFFDSIITGWQKFIKDELG